MPTVTASWALAQSADSTLAITKEALKIATSDNVQLLALLAAEKFGATLPISQQTRGRIEKILRKQMRTPMQKFLLTTIGFEKGGTIEYLSRSLAGLNFLSFAAALIATGPTFNAALLLETMIRDTAEDRTTCPSAYQIRDLLDIIEPNLAHTGFLNQMIGYMMLLSPGPLKHRVGGLDKSDIYDMPVPAKTTIQKLVGSLAELLRLGDDQIRGLVIAVGPCAAWVCAIAHWCLDSGPSIYLDGKLLLPPSTKNSLVEILVSSEYPPKVEVEIRTVRVYDTSSDVFQALLEPSIGQQGRAYGLIPVHTHGQLTLRQYGFSAVSNWNAFRKALQLLILRIYYHNTAYGLDKPHFWSDPIHPMRADGLNCFPAVHVVEAAMKLYLGSSDGLGDSRREKYRGERWSEGLYEGYLAACEQDLEILDEHKFEEAICHIATNILVLSLMVEFTPAPSELLLNYEPLFIDKSGNRFVYNPTLRKFRDSKIDHRESGRLQEPPEEESWAADDGQRYWSNDWNAPDLMEYVAALCGHNFGTIRRGLVGGTWAGSSHKGQVMLPRVLLGEDYIRDGFMAFAILPGYLVLEEQNKRFSLITTQDELLEEEPEAHSEAITATWNAFPQERLIWQVVAGESAVQLKMHPTFSRSSCSLYDILAGLFFAIATSECHHKMEAIIPIAVNVSRSNVGTVRPLRETDDGWGETENTPVIVYPVYDNDGLRMFAIACHCSRRRAISKGDYIALNRGACISCALATARAAGCNGLIL